jgi:prepilin-type N-terminal cleavage/methylation domain-containing protein
MAENHPRRGFTLVELLVAIGIIVILIGLLIPVVTKVRKSAYGASTANQISVLSTAIEQYHNDFNAYPGPLPLNQINYNASSSDPNYTEPFIYDSTGAMQKLKYSPTAPTSTAGTFNLDLISGPQNLVLGLLGGLKVVNSGGTVTFEYDPTVIYSQAGTNLSTIPAPAGPSSLNLNTPKTSPAYITATASDLSNPFDLNAVKANASFADAAGRAPHDTIIPVFVDKYPDAMPILYMRAQRGASGLVSFAGDDKPSGTSLNPDPGPPGTTQVTSWQYDLREIYPYTNSDATSATSNIGVNMSKKILGTSNVFVHGLQKVWVSASTPGSIISTAPLDAWIYLRNPSLGPAIPTSGSASDIGAPRQKDGYILISAGPDRLYGTTDDAP